jgi:hypothetical protein
MILFVAKDVGSEVDTLIKSCGRYVGDGTSSLYGSGRIYFVDPCVLHKLEILNVTTSRRKIGVLRAGELLMANAAITPVISISAA